MDTQNADALLSKAKTDLDADMENRGIAAIIWNNAMTDFHFQPEILHTSSTDPSKTRVAVIIGIYDFNGELYLIEDGRAPIDPDDFYNSDTEQPPMVVTLTENSAREILGDPTKVKGYTTRGSLEEWTAIADCYFEALNLKS